ncbi:MAG: hypothetical protein ABJA34_03415 [Pseudonocardiales bacterium]
MSGSGTAEIGILDLHTTAGVLGRFPEEAARRNRLGKFYHRPPGGESWADVSLRLRSLITRYKRAADNHLRLVGINATEMLHRDGIRRPRQSKM